MNDYKTWETEAYLRRKQEELECDMKRRLERTESEYRASNRVHSDISFNPKNLVLTEAVCVLIVVVSAARLLGLI